MRKKKRQTTSESETSIIRLSNWRKVAIGRVGS